MGFQTAGRNIQRTIEVPITGAGDAALGAEWVLLAPADTPGDVAISGGVAYSPITFDANPFPRYDQAIVDVNGFRVSGYVQHEAQPGAGTGNGGLLVIFDGVGGAIRGLTGLTYSGGEAASNQRLSFQWGLTTLFKTVTFNTNAWYRVGIEYEPIPNAVRFYWNPNPTATADLPNIAAANAGLVLQETLPLTQYVPTSNLFAGFNVALASNASPEAGTPNFNGFDHLLIEEFTPVDYAPNFPASGRPPEAPVQSAYTFFKHSVAIRDILSNARIQ